MKPCKSGFHGDLINLYTESNLLRFKITLDFTWLKTTQMDLQKRFIADEY